MILPVNAGLIVSVANQLIKLGGRVDALMAEQSATQSAVVLRMPSVLLVDLDGQMRLVRDALANTAGTLPDPFGTDRPALNAEVNPGPPTVAFGLLFGKYFPDTSLLADPDADFLAELKAAFPRCDWRDPATRIAAFAITAGTDSRQIGFNARVALAVVDTLFEFGAENAGLIVRDERLRGIVQTVLQRLAQPDWDSFEQWSPLLQTALKATLNAAVDVGAKLPPDNPWLAGVLDALVQARSAAAKPDDYVLGLLQGQGVQLFLKKGLLVAGERLTNDQAAPFKLIAADLLSAIAPMIENTAAPDIGRFFSDHWGDLLRAGLSSLDRHGDLLLDKTNPLLGSTLKALVRQLSTTPNAGFLTSETLYQLASTAISVVANNPGEVSGLESKPWLGDLLSSAAKTAQQLTLKKLFTPAAAEALVLDGIGVLAKHPDLIINRQGLPLSIATSIFSAVSQLPRLDARAIGESALRASLTAIAADPSLAANKFGPVVTDVAGSLARQVSSLELTSDQAAAIASLTIEAIARNPRIYAGLEKDIAGAVVSAVRHSLPRDTVSWAEGLLVQVVGETLVSVARHGGPKAGSLPETDFEQLLTTVVTAGFTVAASELGTSHDLQGVPTVIGGLVAQALLGNLTVFDPTSPEFLAAYKQLAAVVSNLATPTLSQK